MKKYFIVLLSAAACQFCAAGAVSAQLSLEDSYGSLKASRPGVSSAKAALPQLDRETADTQPQNIWPLPGATQWYWNEPADGLELKQIEAALPGVTARFAYSSFQQVGGQVNEITLIKDKKKKPLKLSFGTTAVGPVGLAMEILFDGSITETRVAYASAQDAGKRWLAMVLFNLGNYQFYFKTEAEARAFIDLVASCNKLAGFQFATQDKYGFRTADLTPAQVDALGKIQMDSALVTMVFFNSPAEKAKLAFLDLITEVDGVKVRNAGHFDSILEAAAPGAVLKLACLERTIVMEGDQKKFVWTPKIVELPVK